MKLQIRFLKQGLLTAEIPEEEFDKMTDIQKLDWANYKLASASDRELADGLSDESSQGTVVFSAPPSMEAIENENGDMLIATKAWAMWSRDPKGDELAHIET